MAHPQMFDDDDPLFWKVKEIALELPGAEMKVSHGRPAFFTKKIFCYFGGSFRSQHGEWTQHAASIVFVPDPDDVGALEADERVYVPAYLGPSGWLGLDIDESTDIDEIRELLDASFRLTAPMKLISELDS